MRLVRAFGVQCEVNLRYFVVDRLSILDCGLESIHRVSGLIERLRVVDDFYV